MADNLSPFDIENEELFSLPGDDPSGILSSTRGVIEQGENVWINADQINHLCDVWGQEEKAGIAPPPLAGYEQYHFYDGTERSVNWIRLLDALNFCVWAEKNQP